MSALKGRVAIVTGGGRGIGVAYCGALLAAGASVAIVDVADSRDVAERLGREHGPERVIDLRVDVSDESQVRHGVARALEFGAGRIDVLVNNAALFATLEPAAITAIDVALWDRVMAVNVRGTFLMIKHVAPHMIARRYGKIINITSGTAYKGFAYLAHYATSKGALTTLTRSAARELGEHQICVNSLAPGAVMSDTVMANTAQMERFHQHAPAQRALRREMFPEDLLGALVFLASAASDFVTGQTLAVDGGSVNT